MYGITSNFPSLVTERKLYALPQHKISPPWEGKGCVTTHIKFPWTWPLTFCDSLIRHYTPVFIHVQVLAYSCSCITVFMITWIRSGTLQNYIEVCRLTRCWKVIETGCKPISKTFACCFTKSWIQHCKRCWWVHKIHSFTEWKQVPALIFGSPWSTRA